MTEKIKKTAEDAKAVGRGIKQVFQVTVGVLEALAWIVLISTGWVIVWHVLKNYIQLNDALFIAIVFSTSVISLRFAHAGMQYFRSVGNTYAR